MYPLAVTTRDWIVKKIGPDLFEALAGRLSGSELKSLLLEVMQSRARGRRASSVLEQYERDGFCQPAPVDQRLSLAIDAELLAAAQGFEAIELSPLAPFAATAAFALTDQNRVVSTTRGTEVVSDPTNVLALECARRLSRSSASVHLATCHRVVRAQPFPKLPGYAPHFKLFALASAGIEERAHGFLVPTFVRHVNTLLAIFARLERSGYSFGARRLEILSTAERAPIAQNIVSALGEPARLLPLDHPYYSGGLRFRLFATLPDGSSLPLGDGGVFDWVARLTSNRRAVFVASGLGAQLISMFRVAQS